MKWNTKLVRTADALAKIELEGFEPVTVIGTESICQTFDLATLLQACHAATCPGVTKVVLNPDAHVGYGAPIGCVMVSPDHIYPGPVGVDIKCSMSLMQFDLDEKAIADRRVRRALINAICERTPTGPGRGQRSVKKARRFPFELYDRIVTEGATREICRELGVPEEWSDFCEDATCPGHNGTVDSLKERLEAIRVMPYMKKYREKMEQLGSYGGGNHFGECEIMHLEESEQARFRAETFGLRDGCVSFLSHCGSRGFGNILAQEQFRVMARRFERDGISFPAGDRHLVYARLGTKEADDYWDDMAMGANFATVNHLLINALVAEAFREIFPNIGVRFVYLISHNIARREPWEGAEVLVHRKGATRAFPAGHPCLKGTPFETTGHPILLPGNPVSGSVVMAAEQGARLGCYSVNHGAGRMLARGQAIRSLDQRKVDSLLSRHDILTNCRNYPKDEAPIAYKKFGDVLESVTEAGLASVVARLKARFVVKDGDHADD